LDPNHQLSSHASVEYLNFGMTNPLHSRKTPASGKQTDQRYIQDKKRINVERTERRKAAQEQAIAELGDEQLSDEEWGVDEPPKSPFQGRRALPRAGPPHVPGTTESGLKTISSVAEL
jgi:hypothetical protein